MTTDANEHTQRADDATATNREIDFRKRWYEAHAARFAADEEYVAHMADLQAGFTASAPTALAILDRLRRDGDLESFRAALQEWAVAPGTLAFNGFSGQMLVNQLAKRTDDPVRVAAILSDSLAPPRRIEEAATKITALVDYVETIRVGAHPAPGHVPFLLSYFWALQDHTTWPVVWSSAAAFAEYVTGGALPSQPADRYAAFVDIVRQLDDDNERFERVAAWWESDKPVFVDRILADRCRLDEVRPVADNEALRINAAVLVRVAHHLGMALSNDVSAAAGRTLRATRPGLEWAPGAPRVDMPVDWFVANVPGGLSFRLWVNGRGAAIGLRPGLVRPGWLDEAAELLGRADVPGFRMLAARGSRHGEDVGFKGGSPGEFVYARWFDSEQFPTLDLRREIVAAAAAAQPELDRLVALATGVEAQTDDPLKPFVDEFLNSQGYPTPADAEHRADRESFARFLDPETLPFVDPIDLRRIWNTGRYGSPGPQSVLNTSFRDADPAELDRILASIDYLCNGGDDDPVRIDRVLTDDARRVRGLGESVIMKLLAISHPQRYLCVYPYVGTLGKRRMLKVLDLAEPDADSPGAIQVAANDALLERLDRFFPGDPWGMSRFLYWYAERVEEPEQDVVVDPLDQLADELLVDRSFLDDIVALLEDKGQVVFYGPPGTGKTYLARRLAETLVTDPSRRALVQFHPSTSYEDFFEGYRPETSESQELTYRLTSGPLAMLAQRALEAPGKRHIMIIDEINRANLPKVLGELLFLLEYRDQSIRTLYRPDDAFELPKELWFIGTMNTADRSIALVDAALRRRFHFVPFFPNHGVMKGLLERWLAANASDAAWVGELVAQVNDELTTELGGPHLQLGPSHFMKRELTEQALQRIWQYNIEPFIEDQFFGDPERIEFFRFDSVLKRYRESVPLEGPVTGEGEVVEEAAKPVSTE